ncbi:hypothetical protein BPAE_0211g00120 [Botrytis paeoniae]|uniref:Uncharacterized protein n=1 Tax=Botrytis paeoniae TaxID=278948 RepID=A0A4Z1FFL1_9HELO|nr:hypothetical protein BPAE_0211g00120 [Botrytis paeoniae]
MVYDKAGILQAMEISTKYEWSGTKSIEESSDVEADLFVVMCEESRIVKRIAFLVANVVFVMKRNIIMWTDFLIPQFFIEMCLKATGCPCESYHSGLSEVDRQEPFARFTSGNEEPFAIIMSTKLSAFSDLQEGQVLARIYRVSQTRSSRAHKLVVEDTFMQVRTNKRFHKVVPDSIAHMAQEDGIAESDAEYLAEISNPDGANSAEKIQDAVEILWGKLRV